MTVCYIHVAFVVFVSSNGADKAHEISFKEANQGHQNTSVVLRNEGFDYGSSNKEYFQR